MYVCMDVSFIAVAINSRDRQRTLQNFTLNLAEVFA